jgi:type II secretory pathway pseudopilin PulG
MSAAGPVARPRQRHAMRFAHRTRRRTLVRGLTVTELTAVIAVIAVVMGITLLVLSGVKGRARTMQCLANQRQIAMACASYASSNVGKLVNPRTTFDGSVSIRISGGNVSWSTLRREYVHLWVLDRIENGRNNLGSIQGEDFEKPEAVTEGKLFPYLGATAIYVSPDEPATPTNLTTAGITGFPQRPRSYSLNGLLGVSRPEDTQLFDPYFTAPLNGKAPTIDQFNTTALSLIRLPSKMMCSVVEDDTFSFNLNGFLVAPNEARWFDTPAFWRRDAITLSYVDGSVEAYPLSRRTLPEDVYRYGHTDSPGSKYVQPPDVGGIANDWKFFRDRMNPGVIPEYPRFGLPQGAE